MSATQSFVETVHGQTTVQMWITPKRDSYETEVSIRMFACVMLPKPWAPSSYAAVTYGPYSTLKNREQAIAAAHAQALAAITHNPKQF